MAHRSNSLKLWLVVHDEPIVDKMRHSGCLRYCLCEYIRQFGEENTFGIERARQCFVLPAQRNAVKLEANIVGACRNMASESLVEPETDG